jgi:hypothetical protein
MSTTAILPTTVLPAEDHTSRQPDPEPANPRPGQDPRPADATPGQPGRSHQRAAGALVSVVINFVAPVLAYYLIRSHVSSSAMALALSGAIPVAYTLVVLAVRRHLDVLGVISVVTFGIGVLVSWASGGNVLALELQEPVLSALVGLACLVSVAIGRPLHRFILRLLSRNDPRYAGIADRSRRSSSMIITLILGLTFASHAAALIILAVTEPASRFVALQHPVGLPFLGAGIAVLFLYRGRLQARQQAARDDQS